MSTENLIAIANVAEITGLAPSTIRRRAADPSDSFPPPLKLGPNAVRWRRRELEEWIAACPRAQKPQEF